MNRPFFPSEVPRGLTDARRTTTAHETRPDYPGSIFLRLVVCARRYGTQRGRNGSKLPHGNASRCGCSGRRGASATQLTCSLFSSDAQASRGSRRLGSASLVGGGGEALRSTHYGLNVQSMWSLVYCCLENVRRWVGVDVLPYGVRRRAHGVMYRTTKYHVLLITRYTLRADYD